jgi:hypothetical protein
MPKASALARVERKLRSLDKWMPPVVPKGADFSQYANDPVGFFRDVLGLVHITDEQVAIALSVRDKPETNVQASHSVGKSHISAHLVLWWVFAVGGLAITTAPTESQVKQILWSEIRKAFNRHKLKLGGKCDILQLKLSETARAYGFTARNYDSNSFQGKHAEKMLLIQDEACGITQEIDDGFESCITGSSNRGLRIGNPIDSQTPFEKACKRSHIRIPVWNHPNVAWAYQLDEDGIHRLKPEIKVDICDEDGTVKPQAEWPPEFPRDVIPGAVSIGWIEKARLKGENSVFWLSRVEGLFPTDSGASIVPQSWFLAARARYDADPEKWDAISAKQPWRHGLDVGDGGDSSCIASWRGPVLYAVKSEPTRGDRFDTARAATLGRKALIDKPGWCAVDQIGVGAGTLTMLLEQELQAFGINWGHQADVPDEFLNLKAEQYWTMREAFRTEEVAIAPLGEFEDEVMEDLSGTWYEETSAGKMRIEDKAKTRKRLGRSPNCGDAAVFGFGHTPVIEFSSSGKRYVADEIQDFLEM